ncbi:hypothetical protein BDF22DRAFT_739067 [Syncephalis plumigaleata]|nr:hypothetical protein BDF22DRAFT_739067 [Syncephalis plumigaleata]
MAIGVLRPNTIKLHTATSIQLVSTVTSSMLLRCQGARLPLYRCITTSRLCSLPKTKSSLIQAIQKTNEELTAKANKPAKRLERLLETAEDEQYRRTTPNVLIRVNKRHLSQPKRATIPSIPEDMNLHITKTPSSIKLLQQQQQQQQPSPSRMGKRFQSISGNNSNTPSTLVKDDDEVNTSELIESTFDPEEMVDIGYEYQPGDLVEVIKVKRPLLLVVHSKQVNGIRYNGLLSNGDTVEFQPSDVVFHTPDFLKSNEFKSLFAKGLMKSGTGERVDMQQLIHDKDGQQQTLLPQVARRILSVFDRMTLSRQWSAIIRMQQIYTEFHEQNNREVAGLEEIAKHVYANEDGSDESSVTLTYTQRYAVHRFLSRDPLHFIPERSHFSAYENIVDHLNMSMGQFRFRPLSELKRINEAIRMINEKDAKFNEFLRRAHKMIDLKRSNLLANSDNYQLSPYSDTDLSFLELVRAFIHAEVNNIPRNPFVYPTSEIIKPLRYYDDLDADTASAFLVDMGVWPAWENVVTLKESVPLAGHTQSKQLENAIRRNNKLAQRLLAVPMFKYQSKSLQNNKRNTAAAIDASISIATPKISPSSNPEEFYTKDIVEHLRMISDGQCWLHVHVADPTAYIPPQHLIARRAQGQGSTIYFPERHYPMLPDDLSIQRFSLGVNRHTSEPQSVLTFSARLNTTNGQLEDFKVRAGIIRKVHVLQYDKVDGILDWSNITRMKNEVIRRRMQRVWHIDDNRVLTISDIADKTNSSSSNGNAISLEMQQDLHALQQLANLHMSHRVQQGMLLFSLPSSSVSTKPFPLPITQQHPLQLLRYQQPTLAANRQPPSLTLQLERAMHSPARLMVAELMVIAGRVCGTWCHSRQLPVHYRAQKAPVGLPRHLADTLMEESTQNHGMVDFMLFQQARSYMLPVTQQLTPGVHWTMGIHDLQQGYVKCTSPLRRYTDMLVHWQIKSQLIKEADPRSRHSHAFTVEQLDLLGHRMLAKERAIRILQNTSSSSLFRSNLPLDWSTLGARHWPSIVINVTDTESINYGVLILDLGLIVRLVPDKGKVINTQLKLGDKLFCRIFKTSRDKSLLWAVEADGSACDDGRDLEKLAVF